MSSRLVRFAGSVLAIAVSSLAATATADTDAVTSFAYRNVSPTSQKTYGWAFSLSKAVVVTNLGLWDCDGGGLSDEHKVSIWTSAGILQLSDTVPSGLSNSGAWQWKSVAQTTLAPGQYVIGAYYALAQSDFIAYNCTDIATSTPAVTWVHGRYLDSGDGFPTQVTPLQYWGYFGPNFRYRDPDLVPESAVGQLPTLLALGGAGLWWRRRRGT